MSQLKDYSILRSFGSNELMGYPLKATGIHNVATVLIELAESLSPQKLSRIAKLQPVSWVQRLGYMLERFSEEKQLAESLKSYITAHAHNYTLLEHCMGRKYIEREPNWKILVNTGVYPDLPPVFGNDSVKEATIWNLV